MVTLVALPPKVLPETVTGFIPQVLPEVSASVRRGGLVHSVIPASDNCTVAPTAKVPVPSEYVAVTLVITVPPEHSL